MIEGDLGRREANGWDKHNKAVSSMGVLIWHLIRRARSRNGDWVGRKEKSGYVMGLGDGMSTPARPLCSGDIQVVFQRRWRWIVGSWIVAAFDVGLVIICVLSGLTAWRDHAHRKAKP